MHMYHVQDNALAEAIGEIDKGIGRGYSRDYRPPMYVYAQRSNLVKVYQPNAPAESLLQDNSKAYDTCTNKELDHIKIVRLNVRYVRCRTYI